MIVLLTMVFGYMVWTSFRIVKILIIVERLRSQAIRDAYLLAPVHYEYAE